MKNTLIAILFLLLPLLQACKKETPQEMRKRLISQKEAPKQTVDTTKTETIKDSVIVLVPEPKVECDTTTETVSTVVTTTKVETKPTPKKATPKPKKKVAKQVTPAPKAKKPVAKKPVTYVIGKKDNYYSISRSTNVPVKELMKLNRNKKLKVGDTLRLTEL